MLVYFQYFYKIKYRKTVLILAFLRFLTIFTLLLLLINPKIQNKYFETIKPKLLVAIDNSSSITYSKQDSIVKNLVEKIERKKEIVKKFDVEYFTFGTVLKNNTNYSFQDSHTNISQALNGLNSLSNQQIAPIILISDGNQTFGRDYKYYQSKQAVYPVIVGDTTQLSDLEITQINANSYSYLHNNFPVEVFVRYTGNKSFSTNFIAKNNNKVVYSQKVTFSRDNKSAHLQFILPSNKVGKHLFKCQIKPFVSEKNTVNNFKNFSVDIIDEQSKVAIVYDILHPDIGMLKRSVESNKQRKVNLIDVNLLNSKLLDNDVFVLYQPNNKFKIIFEKLENSNKNYFIITGKQTDWNFLNNIQNAFKKNVLLKSEKYYPDFNKNFETFFIEDIGFSNFSPLEDIFGQINFSIPNKTILTQTIEGYSTDSPLLSIFTNSNRRGVVLFGENIWKWRALSYQSDQSFQRFDQFLNSIIQYITLSKKTNQLELDYNSFYYSDETIKITAKSYDSNFNFDAKADLKLIIEGSQNTYPFYLNKNIFVSILKDLKRGDYNFKVINSENNKQVKGTFTVVNYSIEQEVLQANTKDLKTLANNSKGQIYHPNQMENLFKSLLTNQDFKAIQKEKIIKVSLIDWEWLLGLIVLYLASEWFIRKYRGLI